MRHPEHSWDRLHHMQVATEYERKAELAQRILSSNQLVQHPRAADASA